MTELILKIWTISLNQQNAINKASMFSYEITSNIHYEICSLYSNLIYNPQSLLQNTTKEMKNLVSMIEQFALICHSFSTTTSQTNLDDHSQLTVVRLKFLNFVSNDSSLFEICEKNIQNFHLKLINIIIFAYVNSTSVVSQNNNHKDYFEPNSNSASSTNLTEKELCQFVNSCMQKVPIFGELGISFGSSVEQLLIEFIQKYSYKLKQTQVDLISNFKIVFQS